MTKTSHTSQTIVRSVITYINNVSRYQVWHDGQSGPSNEYQPKRTSTLYSNPQMTNQGIQKQPPQFYVTNTVDVH